MANSCRVFSTDCHPRTMSYSTQGTTGRGTHGSLAWRVSVDCSSTWPRIPRHSCRTIHQGDELDGHLGTKTCLCCTRPRMINRSVPDKTHARQPTSPHTSLCSAVLARVCAVPATSATKSGPTHLRGPAARADCALCGCRPAVPVSTQGPGTLSLVPI